MSSGIARKLQAFFDAEHVPFSWQSNNCAHFGARWLLAAEGSAPPLLTSGLRQLRAAHPGPLPEAVTRALARQPLSFGGRYAQTGDLAAAPVQGRPGRWRLGVVNGRLVGFLRAEGGVVFSDTALLAPGTVVWRVAR